MAAYLDHIDVCNPAVNAIVSRRDRDELLAESAVCDEEIAHDLSRGWMHGMPQAIKDLAAAKGLPMTMGSPLLEHFVPDDDCLMVARMKAAGCVVIGKTNVPEFGLGSHTFNEVFGVTRNPIDLDRTAGGSSGGAAVALATQMLPVADGSDYMGSLRNPAAWNNIFGYRPSQGRVPGSPERDSFMAQMSTHGPRARWPAPCSTSPCCSAHRPVTTGARPTRCRVASTSSEPSLGRGSRWKATRPVSASDGSATSTGTWRWNRGSSRCATKVCNGWPSSGAMSNRRRSTCRR